MRESLDWWRSLRELAQNTSSEYVNWDERQSRINLIDYCDPFLEYKIPLFDPISTENRINSLETTPQTQNIVEKLQTAKLISTEATPRIDGILLLIAVCIDIKAQSLENRILNNVDDKLSKIDKISEFTDNDSLIVELATDMTAFLTEIQLMKAVERELQNIVLSPESRSEDIITNRSVDAIADRETKTLEELYRAIVTCRWKKRDLDTFDHRSFEELIATLYRIKGYEVEIKSVGADGGVDVVAWDNDMTKAIQVKHESGRMSAPKLDRYVSLFEYYDTDEVVIVHKCSFTQPARERASKISKRFTLINGQKLCCLLTDSNISVPVLSQLN